MEGAAVQQMAERFAKPQNVGDGLVALPDNWGIEDPEAKKWRPTAALLAVATLSAVQRYLAHNRDGLKLGDLVVHVESPTSVKVLNRLDGEDRTREGYLVATATDMTTNFLNGYHATEHFMIGLQTRFVETPARTDLLRFLSNIKTSEVKTALDDGMTQVVEARKGVALVDNVPVPNPVRLHPFRTFRELDQPESPFVLRLQQGLNSGLPTAALFEADGGAWRLQAIERIKDWLVIALPPDVSVIW